MRDCRLRALVERAGDVIWTVDMTMRPTYISPSIQRHLGYTASEGMNLNMEDVFSPESYRQAMLLLAAELARDDQPDLDPDRGSLLEIEMVHKDGHYVPFEVHYSAIRDSRGKPVEIVAIARNIATRRADEEFRTESTRRQLEALRQTVRSLAALGEMRDSYTAIHQRRVAVLACAIGEAIGLDTDALEGLRIAGLIHDIGKVRVPAEILTRPGRLTSAEIEIIKTHPYVGYQVLSGIDFPWAIADMVYQHHERLDGSGYPLGLTEDRIIPGARILAVADVVEAIASDRPYRAALGTEAALEEISKKRGVQYDASAVDACLALFQQGYRLEEDR
jgi:PAS domain S-box-containing protein/putative nucleotidyltransferase with HDIG domain